MATKNATNAKPQANQAAQGSQMSCFKDREILNDALLGQKQVAASYNTFAGECTSAQLKNAFLNILNDEHCIQADIFQDLLSRGWYQVEQAEKQKIQQAKQKLTQAQ